MLEAFKLFVTVYEQKSFSRAAALLHLSQPGVSVHVQHIEAELGAKLFHRTPKQVKPTQAGELFYRKAKQILSLYQEAQQEIQQLQGTVSGRLKIGASFTIGEYLLPKLLAEYAARYPSVSAEVTIANTEQINQAVRANELDVGLVEGDVPPSDLHVEPFYKDELVLVAAVDHPLTRLKSVSVDHLHDQVWIFRESGSGTRAYSDRLIRQWELRVAHSYVFSSSQGVKEAVAAGLGIALLSRLIVGKELASGELAVIPMAKQRFSRDFCVLKPAGEPASRALQMFLDRVKTL
ncbi:LysR family transcriptional regulator [Brevibacillus thermoruber]|uniref:LysR family transcriptional regulator n=1 Tax=Brevibacillus thermoruber TaxID=33942 RepID=UPI00054CF691|nr:LysR family transcriptional regulator [Brevibacillus thermoruber]